MADSTEDRTSRSGREREDGRPPRDEERDRANGQLSAKELAEAAMATVTDLTGYEPESVSGLQWDGESWLVTVDVLELARIPNTTDVLANYVVQLDDNGGLLGYKRTRRFLRSQLEED